MASQWPVECFLGCTLDFPLTLSCDLANATKAMPLGSILHLVSSHALVSEEADKQLRSYNYRAELHSCHHIDSAYIMVTLAMTQLGCVRRTDRLRVRTML